MEFEITYKDNPIDKWTYSYHDQQVIYADSKNKLLEKISKKESKGNKNIKTNINCNISYGGRPKAVWRYICNEEYVTSAKTRQKLKDNVINDRLVWDEPIISNNNDYQIIHKKYPINMWKYVYTENNEYHTIFSPHKSRLRNKVLSKGLKWKEYKIKEYIPKFEILYKPYPISIWNYKVYNENNEKYVISAYSKQRLKDKVVDKGYKWDESIKIKEILPKFEIINRKCCNKWSYVYIQNNKKHVISANTKQKLKEAVISKRLIWDDTKINDIDFEIIYIEYLDKWCYKYIDNNKINVFSSYDKQKLIEFVLNKGLQWGEYDVSIWEFEIEFKREPIHTWVYRYTENNNKHVISAHTKQEIMDIVSSKGFIWDDSRIKGLIFVSAPIIFRNNPSSKSIGYNTWSKSHYK